MINNYNEASAPISAAPPNPGPFLATVISHLDSSFMGKLLVRLQRAVGNSTSDGQLVSVSYLNPFYGATGVGYIGDDVNNNNYNNTQKSYGMWMVPPDVGTTVVVIFIEGNHRRGYWIGCVQDENMNFMLPGLAATANVSDGDAGVRAPVAEYNKKLNTGSSDPTKFKKPKHPLTDVFTTQGLLADDIRGITTSSARRELPSMVFGISTPGPVDKQTGAQRGPIGTKDGLIPDAYVSRLGGTTFVMDDGDDKFLRRGPASSTPPSYASIEGKEYDGDVTIPHNELVRIRTRTGHQILLHNSEDLIYIGNARGTTWIELTSNGKIDIYAKDSISVHSENDINFTADRDINLTAGKNINMNAGKSIFQTAATNLEIKVGADGKITAGGSLNFTSAHHVETATKIDMNGPTAAPAGSAPKAARVPMHEPWSGHENLDPAGTSPGAAAGTAKPPAPTAFSKYTTTTDPFNKGFA